MISKGKLFVVSGPSGAGKGSINQVVCRTREDVHFSISATSRNPRPGEVNGVHYHFIDRDTFKKKIDNGEFLEWALVHGNYYGTLKSEVDQYLEKGINVLLEIDIQGARQIMEKGIGVFVFIMPPSYKILYERILKRGTEDQSSLNIRMNNALGEVRQATNYHYYIINDKLDRAIDNLNAIIIAENSKNDNFLRECVEQFERDYKCLKQKEQE